MPFTFHEYSFIDASRPLSEVRQNASTPCAAQRHRRRSNNFAAVSAQMTRDCAASASTDGTAFTAKRSPIVFFGAAENGNERHVGEGVTDPDLLRVHGMRGLT